MEVADQWLRRPLVTEAAFGKTMLLSHRHHFKCAEPHSLQRYKGFLIFGGLFHATSIDLTSMALSASAPRTSLEAPLLE